MNYEEAKKYFDHRLNCGQCGENTTQREAFDVALKCINIADGLKQELSTMYEVVEDYYEIFIKYNLKEHTEIEELAWRNFGKIVQNYQWIMSEVE